MQFYCYVYYDENWQAYYVGKGQGGRMYAPKGHPELPPEERIQVFHFEHEWQAWECEIELIAFWKRQCDGGPLLNRSTGGPGTPGVKASKETLAKLSARSSGENNPNYGKKMSHQQRQKLSRAHTGKILTEEHKSKVSAYQKGRPKSAEHRAKIAAANTGKKFTEERKAKLRAAWVIRKQKKQQQDAN